MSNLFPDMIRCDSPTFGDDLLAYVQRQEKEMLIVRFDLPADHPAVKDAIADGHSYEQAEFIDYVPVSDCRTTDGVPYVHTREYLDARFAEAERERTRRMDLARARVRQSRLSLPDLDLHLATKRPY